MDLTLFELHVDEVSFDAPFSSSGGSSDSRSPTTESTGTENESDSRRLLAVVVGLIVALGVAVLLRDRLGDDEDTSVETEEVTIDQV